MRYCIITLLALVSICSAQVQIIAPYNNSYLFEGGAASTGWTDTKSYAGFLIEMETSNTTQFLDTSGNGNSFSNMPNWAGGGVYTEADLNAAGRQEHVVRLDGVDAYLKSDSSTILNGATQLTMGAWFVNRDSTVSYRGIVYNAGTDRNVGLLLGHDGTPKIQFVVRDSDGNPSYMNATNVFITNIWYHIVGRWRASDGNMDLLVNGVDTGQEPALASADNTIEIIDHWMIGCDASIAGRFLQGDVDQAFIDDTYWTDADASNQYWETSPYINQASGDGNMRIRQ